MKLTKEQTQEIKDQQSQENKTKRVTAPELEKILYEAIPVLDHGFIRVVDYMGDDTSVVQSARVSYGKGTKKVSTDSGLIKYLMRHWHSTPFEMCEIKYHLKLPIFIAIPNFFHNFLRGVLLPGAPKPRYLINKLIKQQEQIYHLQL